MTDIYAGARIRPSDFPTTVGAVDTTDIFNISTTAWVEDPPFVRVTFTAPKSGRVLVITSGGMRDNSGVNQCFIHPEIRENDISGAVVLAPSVTSRYLLASPGQATDVMYVSTAAILDGLTPGGTYFGRVMHRSTVSTGGTADIGARGLIVQPIP